MKHTNDSSVNSAYYFDQDIATVMGQYLTQIEQRFIQECLMLHLSKPAVVFDVGGEAEDLESLFIKMDIG